MLSAGRPGTGTCWTAMHKPPTELAQNVQWRVATALRLAATPDAGPGSTCALRKGNDGNMCEQSLAAQTFPLFLLQVRASPKETAPRRAVHFAQAHRAGRGLCRHGAPCPRAPRLGEKQRRRGTCEAVRHFRCGLAGSRVSCSSSGSTSACDACMQNVTTKVRRNQEWLELLETEKTKRYGMAVRALVFETYGIEGNKLLRDLVTTAAENGQCSPHAVGRWRNQLERVLLTAQAGTYLRALGSRVAERLAAEPHLLLTE